MMGVFISVLIGYIYYALGPSKQTQDEIYENQKELLDIITILNHPELENIVVGKYILVRYGFKSDVVLHKGFVKGLYLDWDDVEFNAVKR